MLTIYLKRFFLVQKNGFFAFQSLDSPRKSLVSRFELRFHVDYMAHTLVKLFNLTVTLLYLSLGLVEFSHKELHLLRAMAQAFILQLEILHPCRQLCFLPLILLPAGFYPVMFSFQFLVRLLEIFNFSDTHGKFAFELGLFALQGQMGV